MKRWEPHLCGAVGYVQHNSTPCRECEKVTALRNATKSPKRHPTVANSNNEPTK